MSASLTISAFQSKANFGNVPIRDIPAISNANGDVFVDQIAFANGDNTITVPANRVAVLMLFNSPPATIKLKNTGGDSGLSISTSLPFVLTIGSGVTTFILNASSAAGSVTLVWI